MMNKNKYLILAGVLLLGGITAKAVSRTDSCRLSKDYAINTFIAAQTGGQPGNLGDILDDDFRYSMLQLAHEVSYNKKYIVDFFRKARTAVPDCTVKIRPVMQHKNLSIVKVDMQYRTFTHSDYLTLTNTGCGWKIIFIYEVYEPVVQPPQ